MEIVAGILLLAFIVGLLSRSKGDGLLDTLGSGCSTIIGFIIVTIIVLIIFLNK